MQYAQHREALTGPHPLRWWWLAGAAVGVAAVGAAGTILSPLVAVLIADRDLALSGSSQVAWILGLPVLVFAALVAAGAVLGDVFGHARLFLVGAAGFALASVLGAVAVDATMLLGARLLQGVAAAFVVPQMIGYARAHLPRIEQALAYGLFGLAFVAGPVIGPQLGVQLADAGWRWAFWVLVPAGALAAATAVPLVFQAAGSRVDPLALALAGVALMAAAGIMYPLTAHSVYGWRVWYLAPLMVGCLLFGGCVALEVVRRGLRAGLGAPLVAVLVVAGAAHIHTLQLHAQLAGGLSVASVMAGFLPAVAGAMVGAAIAVVLSVWVDHRGAAAALGAAVIGAGVVHQLVVVRYGAGVPTAGTLMVDAGLYGVGLAIVVASVMPADRGAPPAPAPGLLFAALALGTPVGVALADVFTSPAMAELGTTATMPVDALRDATSSVLIVSIVLLAVAAGVALALGYVRPDAAQRPSALGQTPPCPRSRSAPRVPPPIGHGQS